MGAGSVGQGAWRLQLGKRAINHRLINQSINHVMTEPSKISGRGGWGSASVTNAPGVWPIILTPQEHKQRSPKSGWFSGSTELSLPALPVRNRDCEHNGREFCIPGKPQNQSVGGKGPGLAAGGGRTSCVDHSPR